MADPRLPHLFSPLKVKGLELKNRLVMPPMGTRYGSYFCRTTDRLRRYYAERARGGVGLVIVQFTFVSPEGRNGPYTTGLTDDSFIPGFRELVAEIHAAGAKAAIQLAHTGAVARSAVIGTRPLGPSAVAPKGGEMPKELSQEEIRELVESFAQAARRAREASFDAVEFHAAHGYLLNQFLSPLWNRREDRYGGSVENRTRVLVEIIGRTRELLGEDYPIMVRLCADEFLPGGVTLSEGIATARILEAAGVDILDVSGGIGETSAHSVPSTFVGPGGSLLPLSAAVRQAVGVPVVAVGKLHRPEVAEAVLAEGKADLIALGRAVIADPSWPAKAAEGQWDEIRPCLTCAAPDCHGRTMRGLDSACVVNPIAGRERVFEFTPAKKAKRVAVVGGGAAGIEAAMAAARRGHQVTLYEKEPQLGGQIPLAAAPPHKKEMEQYLRYLRTAVAASSVRVVLGTEVTAEKLGAERPDLVILAAGARPTIPPVPVHDQQVVTAWEVLAGRVETGQKVVIVGGGDVGCETAEFLAMRGKIVTIIEMLPDVASELIWWTRDLLLQQLEAGGVDILTSCKVISLDRGTVNYERGGISNRIQGVDTVVFATGVKPEDSLAKQLAEKGFCVRLVGDCAKPGNLASAVRSGFEAGITLE
ncbi:MAG: FAD-dependent oxidoreductase [Chloroflexota bacterium]